MKVSWTEEQKTDAINNELLESGFTVVPLGDDQQLKTKDVSVVIKKNDMLRLEDSDEEEKEEQKEEQMKDKDKEEQVAQLSQRSEKKQEEEDQPMKDY